MGYPLVAVAAVAAVVVAAVAAAAAGPFAPNDSSRRSSQLVPFVVGVVVAGLGDSIGLVVASSVIIRKLWSAS